MAKSRPLSPARLLEQAIAEMVEPPHAVSWYYAMAILEAQDGNISAAARQMGMHRRTLQRMMDKQPKSRLAVRHG